MYMANKIIADFKPDVVVGVGGYASGPILRAAASKGIPTLIQEQNSYPGVTNKMLADKAVKICVAYEGLEKYFPKEKIVITGNPCRQDLTVSEENRKKGIEFFRLDPERETILLIGGSLGAKTLNESVVSAFPKIERADDVQVIWQCGKYYYDNIKQLQAEGKIPSNIRLYDFISQMDYAYSVADLIISRAGAGSISEFCLLGKPVILVPSPNVAEDHQTKNAQALVEKDAAIMIADSDAPSSLFDMALEVVRDEERLKSLSNNIAKFAQPYSADRIVDEIEKIIGK
jgi:UDP-N-acetylglucosamine--N-acetylmuramyl-(pentapeptide) pyrophosphoryl-undecaprenol N-acetylglucosamine transferase